MRLVMLTQQLGSCRDKKKYRGTVAQLVGDRESLDCLRLLDGSEPWSFNVSLYILTGLSHIHKFDGILFVSFSICGQMYKSKTTFSNLLLHSIVIQDSTEIERFPCKRDEKNIQRKYYNKIKSDEWLDHYESK